MKKQNSGARIQNSEWIRLKPASVFILAPEFWILDSAFPHGSSLPFLPRFFGCSTSRGRVAGGVCGTVVSVFLGAAVEGGMVGGAGNVSDLGAGGNVTCSIFGVVIVSVLSLSLPFLSERWAT